MLGIVTAVLSILAILVGGLVNHLRRGAVSSEVHPHRCVQLIQVCGFRIADYISRVVRTRLDRTALGALAFNSRSHNLARDF